MRTVFRQEVVEALHALQVQPQDGLLVHSALQFLGKPAGGVGMYLDAIREVAPLATLAVPTFNFGFARGEPYDPRTTPSQGMGAFSEWVRQLPEACRTPHPMQSVAVVGPLAAELAALDTPSAFDPGSAIDRMVALDFKVLLLGADIQAVSAIHYSEQRARVPYRFWKDFTGLVNTQAGWEERTYRMFVRDMALDAKLDLRPLQAKLAERDQWRSLPFNYGRISLCRLVDFMSAASEMLAKDPWVFVAKVRQPADRPPRTHPQNGE